MSHESVAKKSLLSFRQIEDTLRAALNVIAPPSTPNGPFWYIADVYADRVIVEWIDGKLYSVAYTIEGDNTIIAPAGEWKTVARGYVAKGARDITTDGYIAKGAPDEPLVFVASGAYQDRDGEWVGREYQQAMVDAINEGRVKMTIDIGHVGFQSRSNPNPSEPKKIIGHIEKAAFKNDHLALLPVFDDPADEATVRLFSDEIGLSIYFNGAVKDAQGVFRGEPKGDLSVALLPRGYESYAYTAIQ